MSPKYWKQATSELAARDAVLQKMITLHKGMALGSRGDAFQTLARAIVGQQISVKAAQSVWNRFATEHAEVTPAVISKSTVVRLRNCGLSNQKAGYLLDLSTRFANGSLEPRRWRKLDDDALVAELVQVKGIGRWTAEMFMMFHLARPNVFPVADLGLQKAMQLHYNRGRKITAERMHRIGAAWAPWRSVATWYLWRSLDPIPVDY